MPNKMERFTQRARRVLSLAQEEAERLRHFTIDTPHMLLGLMREEGGVAGRVLRDLGVESGKIETLLLEMRSPEVHEGARPPIELSDDTKKALELGVDEARRMGHHYIGTEHLLLGLVRQQETAAVVILKKLDISPEVVRRQTRRVLQESPRQSPPSAASTPPLIPIPPREATVTYRAMRDVVSKMLEMVSAGTLTTEQATELLRALQPGLVTTPGEQARLAAQFRQLAPIEQRSVRIVLIDSATNENRLSTTVPLEQLLDGIDQILDTAGQHLLASIEFRAGELTVKLEFRVDEDEGKGEA